MVEGPATILVYLVAGRCLVVDLRFDTLADKIDATINDAQIAL
jgi:hypothetical protein